MNVAVIFAGGTGSRMNSKTKPKQFLLMHGKPIIIYTLEKFDEHPDIDAIVVVCLRDWIEALKKYVEKFSLSKVVSIVPGGVPARNRSATGSSKPAVCSRMIRPSSCMTASGR